MGFAGILTTENASRLPSRNWEHSRSSSASHTEEMIHVLAFITTKPGMRSLVLAEVLANLDAVRAEKGCIEYGPVIDAVEAGSAQTPVGPHTFVVVEKWESLEALQAHAAAPHMAAYGTKVADMIEARAIHILNEAK